MKIIYFSLLSILAVSCETVENSIERRERLKADHAGCIYGKTKSQISVFNSARELIDHVLKSCKEERDHYIEFLSKSNGHSEEQKQRYLILLDEKSKQVILRLWSEKNL